MTVRGLSVTVRCMLLLLYATVGRWTMVMVMGVHGKFAPVHVMAD